MLPKSMQQDCNPSTERHSATAALAVPYPALPTPAPTLSDIFNSYEHSQGCTPQPCLSLGSLSFSVPDGGGMTWEEFEAGAVDQPPAQLGLSTQDQQTQNQIRPLAMLEPAAQGFARLTHSFASGYVSWPSQLAVQQPPYPQELQQQLPRSMQQHALPPPQLLQLPQPRPQAQAQALVHLQSMQAPQQVSGPIPGQQWSQAGGPAHYGLHYEALPCQARAQTTTAAIISENILLPCQVSIGPLRQSVSGQELQETLQEADTYIVTHPSCEPQQRLHALRCLMLKATASTNKEYFDRICQQDGFSKLPADRPVVFITQGEKVQECLSNPSGWQASSFLPLPECGTDAAGHACVALLQQSLKRCEGGHDDYAGPHAYSSKQCGNSNMREVWRCTLGFMQDAPLPAYIPPGSVGKPVSYTSPGAIYHHYLAHVPSIWVVYPPGPPKKRSRMQCEAQQTLAEPCSQPGVQAAAMVGSSTGLCGAQGYEQLQAEHQPLSPPEACSARLLPLQALPQLPAPQLQPIQPMAMCQMTAAAGEESIGPYTHSFQTMLREHLPQGYEQLQIERAETTNGQVSGASGPGWCVLASATSASPTETAATKQLDAQVQFSSASSAAASSLMPISARPGVPGSANLGLLAPYASAAAAIGVGCTSLTWVADRTVPAPQPTQHMMASQSPATMHQHTAEAQTAQVQAGHTLTVYEPAALASAVGHDTIPRPLRPSRPDEIDRWWREPQNSSSIAAQLWMALEEGCDLAAWSMLLSTLTSQDILSARHPTTGDNLLHALCTPAPLLQWLRGGMAPCMYRDADDVSAEEDRIIQLMQLLEVCVGRRGILQLFGSANKRSSTHIYPLHKAARHGNRLRVLQHMLSFADRLSILAWTNTGWQAYHSAARSQCNAALHMLLGKLQELFGAEGFSPYGKPVLYQLRYNPHFTQSGAVELLKAACEAMGISAYCVEHIQEHDVTEGLTEVRVMIRMELQMAALRVTGA